MNKLIDNTKCKKCYICIDICPAKIIEKNSENNLQFIENKKHTCLKCGQCMMICNNEAIQIEGISYENNIFKLNKHSIDYENFYNFLASRRSVRNFLDKPVEREKLDKIIEMFALSPYGVKSDSVEISITNDREIIKKALPYISEFYNKIERWFKNPFMKFMIKKNAGIEMYKTIEEHLLPRIRLKHYEYTDSKDNIMRNAPSVMIFHASKSSEGHTDDSMILATYTMLAAHSLGLGATIIGLTAPAINKSKELKEIFKIPEKNEALISVIIGYPKYHFNKSIKRTKTNVIWL